MVLSVTPWNSRIRGACFRSIQRFSLPAKKLEHFFLRVLPGLRDEATDLCRALTDPVEIRGCDFLAGNYVKKGDTLQEQRLR
jgi:hypothetical protein